MALPMGMTALKSEPGGLALDFVRSTVNGAPMITKAQMTLLPKAQMKGDKAQARRRRRFSVRRPRRWKMLW